MRETSMYECASEIRDAVRQHSEDLCISINTLEETLGGSPTLEERFVGPIFCRLLDLTMLKLAQDKIEMEAPIKQLACMAWLLAGELAHCDPTLARNGGDQVKDVLDGIDLDKAGGESFGDQT